MSLPFTTTTVTVKRFSTSTPGLLETQLTALPSVVGRISGKEVWNYRGNGSSGFREDLAASLRTNAGGYQYNDIIVDEGTTQQYRVVSAEERVGFSAGHFEAALAKYNPTGNYSLFRATAQDTYGDVVPSNSNYAPSAAVWSAIPGEVYEIQRQVTGPVTDVPAVVRVLSGRFPPLVGFLPRDILRNDTTGQAYVVTSVGLVTGYEDADVGVELERYTG